MSYIEAIQGILEHIDAHIGEEMSAGTLAARAGFSEYHFCRVFRWCVGYSVMGYVRSRRLAFAAAELSGGRKILDIALDYGFETHSGFSKAFKRHFGCTPETFRVHTQYSVPIRVSLAQMKDYYIGGIVMDPIFKTLPTLRIAGHAVRTRTVGGENIKAITDFWSE